MAATEVDQGLHDSVSFLDLISDFHTSEGPTDGRPSLDGLALGCFFTSAPDGVGLGAIPTKHSRTSPSHAHKCCEFRGSLQHFGEFSL